MTALADQARDDAEMQRILHDAAIGHRTAARLINELRGQSITSEKSVRRYRRNRHQETPPKPQPRLSASGWTPGIDYDPAEGGEFRTVPRQVVKDAPEAEPEEDALLREWDLDPAVWEVVSARKSLWQGGAGGTWLEARRVSFRKRARGLSAAELDVEGIWSRYTPGRLERQPCGITSSCSQPWDSSQGKPGAGRLGGDRARLQRSSREWRSGSERCLVAGPNSSCYWLGDASRVSSARTARCWPRWTSASPSRSG